MIFIAYIQKFQFINKDNHNRYVEEVLSIEDIRSKHITIWNGHRRERLTCAEKTVTTNRTKYSSICGFARFL